MTTTTLRRSLLAGTAAAMLASLAGATWVNGADAAPGSATADQRGHTRCAQPGPYDLPHGAQPVDLDPAEFTTTIDNPYWPMKPGTTWTFRETDAQGSQQRIEVRVTHRTRTIRGIEARVVHDVVTERGELVENTFDWYAQDSGGTHLVPRRVHPRVRER